MRFEATDFADAFTIIPEPVRDERGFFARTFCAQELGGRDLQTKFVQHSISGSSRKGTLRGMHFQTEPYGEVKIVTCLKGTVFDVIIDLREGSGTFRKWQSFELTAENRHRLYIPKGFAHGFQTLTDDVEILYLISAYYEPSAANGVRHDDPAFGIAWPLPVSVMSDRDRGWADFTG